MFLLLVGGGILTCHAGTRDAVDYRFAQPRLAVSEALPLGTVLAVVAVPCGTVNELQGRVRRELWTAAGRQGMTAMAQTNVRGIGARLVLDTQPVDGDDLDSHLPWSLGGGSLARVQDTVRIELIKTGPVPAGTLTRVTPDVQYRRYTLIAGKKRWVHVRRLHYDGQLVLTPVKQPLLQH